MTKRLILLIAAPIALGACQNETQANVAALPTGTTAGVEATATAPTTPEATPSAANGEKLISRANFEATFDSFLQGDYLYANFGEAKGHETEGQPMVQSGPLAAFLAAHKGKAMTVQVDTVNTFLDPPGERIDASILRFAQVGDQNDAAWWAALSPAAQKAAEKVADDMAAASVEH